MDATAPSLDLELGTAVGVHRGRYRPIGLRRLLTGAVLLGAVSQASAYTATLTPAAPLTVYLQVGVGSFTNNYINGGQPGNNATINTVSTTVAAAGGGNSTAHAMTNK